MSVQTNTLSEQDSYLTDGSPLQKANPSDVWSAIRTVHVVLTLYRFYWVHNDWEILSEGFFAIANILDFAPFVQVFVVIRSIGTLLMPFKNMTQAIFRFFIAFLLFFGAFMVGQTNLYWYYDSRKRSTVERISHVEPSVSEKYTDLFSVLAYSFWSLFGMGDREGYYLQEFKEIDFTQRLGAVFYGAFLVICVLALLNILIAMFVDSYASYQEVMLDIRVRYIQDVHWSALSREYLRIEKLRSVNIANTGDSTARHFSIAQSRVASIGQSIV